MSMMNTHNSSSRSKVKDLGNVTAEERRVLRSGYHNIQSRISENKDDIGGVDCDKFDVLINEVENLHLLVKKPREQVADAQALLELTSTLVDSVKLHIVGTVTPSEFISCLLKNFGQNGVRGTSKNSPNSVIWRDIGLCVSPIFKNMRGCSTMLGPMNKHIKQRKVAARRRYAKPLKIAKPEELVDATTEEKMETDKNLATMFEILKKKKSVKLENLVLNRESFAQTVENLFAMSFLVKDGRVKIVVDEKRSHIVSPTNQPSAALVCSGEVKYSAFIFRFDFKDWKLMKDQVPEGEELMPNRINSHTSGSQAEAQSEMVTMSSQAEVQTEPSKTCPEVELKDIPMVTPIRTYSRNRGFVMNNFFSEGTQEIGNGSVLNHGCKRKLEFI